MDIEIQMNEVSSRPLTLMERIKERYYDRRAEIRRKNHVKYALRLLMALQAPTQLYMFLNYVIPYLFYDYDWNVKYSLKVLCAYFFVMGLTNYLCTVCYNSSVQKSRDRPILREKNRWMSSPDFFVPVLNNTDDAANEIESIKNKGEKEFYWKFCEKCKIYIPPRAHHCETCGICILKRDHHCYMIGACIGFWNQRYFAVLTFYAVICGVAGGYFTYKYLNLLYYPVCQSWMDFIPFVALYKWIMGTAPQLTFHIVIMTTQIYLELLVGFVGFVYFSSQMTIIASGMTLYELAKNVKVKNINSVNHNFRSVFGDFWILNFFFPMQIVLRQHEDGTKWDGLYFECSATFKKL